MARKLERATFGSLFFLSMAKNCSLAAALVGVRTSQLFGYATREKASRCLPVYPVQPRDHNCSLLRCSSSCKAANVSCQCLHYHCNLGRTPHNCSHYNQLLARSTAAEQIYGHKYISYDILIVDTEEVTAYNGIN